MTSRARRSSTTRASPFHAAAERNNGSERSLGSTTHRSLTEGAMVTQSSFRRSITDEMSLQDRNSLSHRLSESSNLTLNKLDLARLEVYGREEEVQQLKSAYESILGAPTNTDDDATTTTTDDSPADAPQNQKRLVLVSGYSGIGKSVLAEQLQQPVRDTDGFFVQGKFDQQQSVEPYTAFIAAFTELTEAILARPQSRDMVKSIQQAVGEEAGAITKVVPTLKRILGFGQKETDAEPENYKNRLKFLFRQFVRAISATNPLVIMLDDLQWADAPSLELLDNIATDPHSSSLLVVGTYRDNEVDENHPFMVQLSSMEQAGVAVLTIHLSGLDLEAVNALVSTALRSELDVVLPLTKLIVRKTGGNPFFVIQFLKSLCKDGTLVYDLNLYEWTWDEEALNSCVVTENVVDLVMGNIKRLPPKTQRVLLVAACLGPSFTLDALVLALDGLENSEILSDFVATDDADDPDAEFRVVDDELDKCVSEGLVDYGRQEKDGVTYAFVHDQIQNAALNLISKEALPALQLHLGQILLQDEESEFFDKYLFVGLDLFNRGSDAGLSKKENDDPRKAIQFARYNLLAGQKAMKATAFTPTVVYAEAGLALLGPNCWEKEYRLTLNLTCLASTAEYCRGEFEKMDRRLDEVLDNASSFDDKVNAYITRIQALCVRQQFEEGISEALHILKAMGLVSIPIGRVSTAKLLLSILRTNILLRRHTKESLSNLPILMDEKRIQASHILEILTIMTYISRQDLLPLIILTLVNWSVEYGVSKYSPGAFAFYGCILCGKLNNMKKGKLFGEVALATIRRLPARDSVARTVMLVYMMVFHWSDDAHLANTPFLYGHRAGMETGDIESGLYNIDFHGVVSWFTGTNLEKVDKETGEACALMQEYNQDCVRCYSLVRWQSVLNLRGKSANPVELTGTAMNEQEMRKLAHDTKNRVLETVVDSYRMVLAYIFRDYGLAIELTERVLDIEDVLVGHFTSTRIIFYAALSALASANTKTKSGRLYKRWGIKLTKKLKKWAKSGNVNCVHMVQFAEAELAALRGNADAAMRYYNECIKSTARNGCVNDRAIVHERAGLFCLGLGRGKDMEDVASYHLKAATKVYRYWGAMGKVNQLMMEYGFLFATHSTLSML